MLFNELHQGGIRALLEWDTELFNGLVVPDGVAPADVVDHIIYKYGDTPLFSPDPSVVKFYIGRWSKRRLPLWERYKTAIETEYNPVENYDRIEDATTKQENSGEDRNDYLRNADFEPGTTTENTISADNSSSYLPDTKTETSGTDSTTESGYSKTTLGSTYETTIKSRIHGNIGITTSQMMVQSELSLIPQLDLIDYIADDFHTEFCLSMYY